ncbi:unnamed protein product [Urochloa humidicola]
MVLSFYGNHPEPPPAAPLSLAPSPPPPLLPSRSPSSPSGSALRGEREARKAQRGWTAGIERLVGDLRKRGAGRKLLLSSVIVELLVVVSGHGAATTSPESIHGAGWRSAARPPQRCTAPALTRGRGGGPALARRGRGAVQFPSSSSSFVAASSVGCLWTLALLSSSSRSIPAAAVTALVVSTCCAMVSSCCDGSSGDEFDDSTCSSLEYTGNHLSSAIGRAVDPLLPIREKSREE